MERKRGLVTEAAGGTLFLDEIGDLSLEAQAMLLRFLQEREVRPLGSTRTVTVDVRVLAATNRNLDEAIARREFRADLYDRLAEIVIRVPTLGERRDDIPALIDHFLALAAERHGVAVPTVTPGRGGPSEGTSGRETSGSWSSSIRRAFVLRQNVRPSTRGALELPVVTSSAPSIRLAPPRSSASAKQRHSAGHGRQEPCGVRMSAPGSGFRQKRRDAVWSNWYAPGVLMRRGGGRRTRYVPCEGVPGAGTEPQANPGERRSPWLEEI